MAHEMSAAETPATTLCARAADGGAGAPNFASLLGVLRYVACARAGLSQAEASRALGVSREAVSQAARRHRIAFRADKKNRHQKGEAA